MGAFPSIDLASLVRVDATGTARWITEKSLVLARDAAYTAVGLGLLTFQRAQVHRREFERSRRS